MSKNNEFDPLSVEVRKPLELLQEEEKGAYFIGRKKSDLKKYGYDASVYLGKVSDHSKKGSKVFLDTLSPHVMFICGARGVGKSYSLGVVVEDLASNNSNVGVVVVDPIGIYWSMKYPNRDKREIEALADWGLVPKGLDNLKVFIPHGAVGQVQGETFDEAFTISPALLTTDDWCLTFGIDRFSPSGLLMEKVLSKVKEGFTSTDGKKVGGNRNFSLEDITYCLDNDVEINSAEKGFKKDSVRALASRFDAARSWGIFSDKGTPLSALSKPGQVSILDISFLDENVASLVIGILARRILTARKIYTRNEAATRLDVSSVDKVLETEIPPTWLLIDEAHTLIPSGNMKTPASNALIEYVKQGRRPGCSLVFATQQPGAIDSQILSQVDLMLSHKLIFGDDIHAVSKRMPSIMPDEYNNASVFKSLPIGYGLVGDRREETSRVFLLQTRPRMSQHEGRETQTLEMAEHVQPVQVLSLISKLLESEVRQAQGNEIAISRVSELLQTLNSRYKLSIKFSELLDYLEENAFTVTEEKVSKQFTELEERKPEEQSHKLKAQREESDVEIEVGDYCFIPPYTEERVKILLDSRRKKKVLGLFGEEESIESIEATHTPLLEVTYNYGEGKKPKENTAFVDLNELEFVHYLPGKGVVRSQGLAKLVGLDEHAVQIFTYIKRKKQVTVDEILGELDIGAAIVRTRLASLEAKKLVLVDKKHKPHTYAVSLATDLPRASEPLLASLAQVRIEKQKLGEVSKPKATTDLISRTLEALFDAEVVSTRMVYLPEYSARLKSGNSSKEFRVDAFTGEMK